MLFRNDTVGDHPARRANSDHGALDVPIALRAAFIDRNKGVKRFKPIAAVKGAGIVMDWIDNDYAPGHLDHAETRHRIDQ